MSSALGNTLVDTSYGLPSLAEIFSVLSFQAGFNATVVVLGTSFLGLAAGIIGTFTLLRGRSLMGDALAHSALPGIALAFIVSTLLGFEGKSLALLLSGATLSGLVGVGCVQALTQYTRLPEDTAIGAVLSVFFGFGVVLLSLIQAMNLGGEAGLGSFIYGQTAALTRQDAILTCSLALISCVLTLLFLKEFRLVCFDRDYAHSIGWSVAAIDLLMMALLVLVTVMGLQSVGLILVIALLIVPAAAARFWTERLSVMLLLSGVFGFLSGYFGATLSALLPRLPAGAIIVLTSGVFFLLSFLFAPKRGTLFLALRNIKLKMVVAKEHLLRECYEYYEKEQLNSSQHSIESLRVPRAELRTLRSLSSLTRLLLSKWLQRLGLLALEERSMVLTELGLIEAVRLVRNHRLWEEYLVAFADIAPANVDRLADLIEHSLPQETIDRLEQNLLKRGILPGDPFLPKSMHDLDGGTQ